MSYLGSHRAVRNIALLGVLLFCAPAPADTPEAPLSRPEIDTPFAEELEQLARRCDALGLTEQAATTRAWAVVRDPGRQTFFLPADSHVTPAADAPLIERQWHAKFLEIRAAHAERLFSLASRQLEEGHAASTFALLHEVLREDADHAEARRVLYFQRMNDRWQRGVADAQPRASRTAHPHLRWRARRYWRLNTEHYSIVTNQSPAAASDLGIHLEMLHGVWNQLFFDYANDPALLAARMAGSPPVRTRRARHKVVLFSRREEYIAHLIGREPRIEISKGLYRDAERTTYLYAGDDSLVSTWYHEATHQLFQERGEAPRGPGTRVNFWVIEAAALYMESLIDHKGFYTTGGFDADRLQFARYRINNARWQIPLADLVGLGREEILGNENVGWLYSQSAGLGHFFMDGNEGVYRPAFMQYLRAVYSDNDGAATLSRLTQVGYGEMDQQYRDFLQVTDDDMAHLLPAEYVRRLSLGKTEVTDRGLTHLQGYDQLVWLDLSECEITDEGVAWLADCRSLHQLGLQSTGVTDHAMETVGRLTTLDELDLSGTALSDNGLPPLSSLTRLTMLWMANTAVTDEGLRSLRTLRTLEKIDVEGTQVTSAGLAALRRTLPRLEPPPAAP